MRLFVSQAQKVSCWPLMLVRCSELKWSNKQRKRHVYNAFFIAVMTQSNLQGTGHYSHDE